MKWTITKLNHPVFSLAWHFMLPALLLLATTKLQAQPNPRINAVNGLVPGCVTEEQALELTINGANFATTAPGGVRVRIRGAAFPEGIFVTPESAGSAGQIKISLAGNHAALADPGTLTVDVQQAGPGGGTVFSNAVQLPVYPKTGAISGAAAVCANGQNNYTVPRLAGAARYEWSVLSGNATVISGGSTNAARLGFGNTAGTVRIAVKTIHSCGTAGTTATLDIQVKAAPTATLAAFGDVCANAPAQALSGGSPAGGTYTVNGVVATSFNPAAAGAGTHTIIYYFTQSGCTASATRSIRVLGAPQVAFPTVLNPLCVGADPLTLTGGAPAGGTYSGPGVSGTTFNPALAGIGTHTITYTITQGGCPSSASQKINVLPATQATLPVFANICIGAPALALASGSPAGGTYEVDGVAATSFDPAAAGIGTHTIAYTVTQNGCATTASQAITVVAAPQVTFAGTLNPLCLNAVPINLTGGAPAGGTYSGPGVSGTTFNPTQAGVGTHTITYALNQNGCLVTATKTIAVLSLPAAAIIADGGLQACPGSSVSLKASPAPAGSAYQWLLNDNPIPKAVNASFDAAVAGSYRVRVTANNCSALSELVNVTMLTASNILVEKSPLSFCSGTNALLHAIAGTEYQYEWYIGDNSIPNQKEATLAVTTPGTYKVIVTPTGCAPITSDAVTVSETPLITNNSISSTAANAVCSGSAIEITGSAPRAGTGGYAYQWQSKVNNTSYINIPGATGQNYTFPSGTFSGTISFQRVVVSGLCSSVSNGVQVTVNQVIANNAITAPALPALCAGNAGGTISGSAATGAASFTYAWESSLNGTTFTPIPNTNTADYSPGALQQTTYFRRVARSGQCASISNVVTITVLPNIAGNSIGLAAATVCSNTNPGAFVIAPLTGGNGTYSYVWESSVAGADFSVIPNINTAEYSPGALTQTTAFRRIVTSGTCSHTSDAFTITVAPPITGNKIAAPGGAVCSDAVTGPITGTVAAGGQGTYSYAWESSLDGTTFTLIPDIHTANYTPQAVTQTTTFRRLVTSGACADTSNAVTFTVGPPPIYTVLLTVPTGLPVCGETTLTARVIKNVSLINYPADPRHQPVTWQGGEDVTEQFLFDWRKNETQSIAAGNTGSSITQTDLQPGEYYTVRARPQPQEGAHCGIYNNRPDLVADDAEGNLLFSNQIYSGHPDGYGIAITSDLQAIICPGGPVTFTAFPNDAAYTNPTYQWTVNQQDIDGAIEPVFTSADIKNGDVVSVRFNSDENTCSPITAGNPITLEMIPQVENRVARIDGPADLQVGKPAIYQAIPADNSIDWRYQWIISFADGREETLAETSPTLTIASIWPDLVEITVNQIALEGNCIDKDMATLTAFTEPLPIELLYLKAKRKGSSVMVEWATAMERNNAGFEVQVSSDAVTYRSLSLVLPRQPDAYTKQVYTYLDQEREAPGTRYYRLKQVDVQGASAYFGPVAVEMDGLAAPLFAYPNPFTREIQLETEAPEAGTMHLTLVNALGGQVLQKTLEMKKGFNKAAVTLNPHLPPGVYTLIAQMNGRTTYLKLVKQ